MHDSHPATGIGGPAGLTSPRAPGPGNFSPDDLVERQSESPDTRKRVLVVEDEFLLSAVLSLDLQEAGYDVLGPFATLALGLEAVETESFDGAILDINLKGELVYPLAEELDRHGIPYFFLSGYEASNMPMAFRSHARLAKPADPAIILHAVRRMLRADP